MDAGREMDALVAEKVMERTICEHSRDRTIGTAQSGGFAMCAKRDCKGELHYDYLPKYSTDIAAAWLVVEAMMQRPEFKGDYFGWDLRVGRLTPGDLSCSPQNGIGAHFGRAFHRPDPWPGSYWAKGDETLQYAICRAALKAIGVDA